MATNWDRLTHAYGSAVDVPQVLEHLGDDDLEEDAWFELWSCLCHQGTVYPASFAALPVLADIATGRRSGDHRQAIALAGRIVAEETQLHRAGYVHEHYPAAIADLHRATLHYLTEVPFEGEGTDYLYPLEALLAFEGVPVWNSNLLPGLCSIVCPSCSASLEADVDDYDRGTRRRDPDSCVQALNFKGSTFTSLRPSAPADLGPLGSRLHHMASKAGQTTAAEHVRYLFGSVSCPDCRAEFSLPEQIEAFQDS